ncbi:hypothetical protein DSCOOX_04320 [Desulfosarcina ovata subsp. ovata]|uniref:Uncharacterized protein n=1 Tax=Desulfosarcina ovata subsp. ovata TaxID=2752305 RepID=A0A5K8A3X8_9BACT|nr:hypothetical protein DSCOOX_04320 [Desulfosarcina ovata subsp. ovata]
MPPTWYVLPVVKSTRRPDCVAVVIPQGVKSMAEPVKIQSSAAPVGNRLPGKTGGKGGYTFIQEDMLCFPYAMAP